MKRIFIMCSVWASLVVFSFSAFAQSPTPPKWVQRLITRLQSEPARNPPAKIVRYTYKGRAYYYVPPACCDQFSSLYNTRGKEICAPDGGITGTGDGKCPAFVAKLLNSRTLGEVVWQDARESTSKETQKPGLKIQVK
jgi:hypothetical protein